MTVRITRHFVTLGARQVHYRRSGSGPPLLLLHQSPASSAECVGLMHELADRFTILSPDTPGNGLSDPLPQDAPSMSDYAAAVVEFMDALGIARTAVYGMHTGAACALALAHRHPQRIALSICNGYTQMAAADLQETLTHYLPPLLTDWSGAHLTWAWSRIRDQYLFFPWFARRSGNRMAYDLPRAAKIHAGVMDLLRAGDHYRAPYRAAFCYDRAAVVGEIHTPTVIMTAKTDVLYPYLDQMPTPGPGVSVLRPTDYRALKGMLAEVLERWRDPVVVPAPRPAVSPGTGGWYRDYVQTDQGSLFIRRHDGDSRLIHDRALLFVHDTADSALSIDRYAAAFIGRRRLLAVDLPGNGESDNPDGACITIERQAQALQAALVAAGCGTVDIVAIGGGGAVAVELARHHPQLVSRVALLEADSDDETLREALRASYAVPVEFDDYGTHWTRAWNQVRDSELFYPWFSRVQGNARPVVSAQLEPQHLQQRTLDLFKSLGVRMSAYAARFAYPLAQARAALRCPVYRTTPLERFDQQALINFMK